MELHLLKTIFGSLIKLNFGDNKTTNMQYVKKTIMEC